MANDGGDDGGNDVVYCVTMGACVRVCTCKSVVIKYKQFSLNVEKISNIQYIERRHLPIARPFIPPFSLLGLVDFNFALKVTASSFCIVVGDEPPLL